MQSSRQIVFTSLGTEGVPLICLHGIGGNAESFRPQLDFFSPTRRTIAWNMPGYGGSPMLPETSFAGLSRSLVTFMDALEIKQAHIMGQSIGGMIAQELVAAFPKRAASLILVATTPSFGGRDESFKEQFIQARLGPLDAGQTIEKLAPEIVREIVGKNTSPHALRSAVDSMRNVPETTYRETIRCLTTFNQRDNLSKIAAPVCLIAGELDNNAPYRTMEKMADKIPNAEFHLIQEAGHLTNLEAPEETNKIVDQFLSRVENDQ